jgi:hypothetical protein
MIYQEKIFTEDECNKIINFSKIYLDLPYRQKEKFIDYSTHRIEHFFEKNSEKKIGKFFHVWDIQNDENSEWMFIKLIDWFKSVSGLKLHPNIKNHNCALHRYSVGDSFMRHVDITNMFSNRMWNIGIQLNSNYTGGDYICYKNNNEEILFSKEAGTTLAYQSNVEHEIKEITSGERWSIVFSLTKEAILDKSNII